MCTMLLSEQFASHHSSFHRFLLLFMIDKLSTKFQKSLVWFRRDLRCFDHAALFAAMKQSQSVFWVFIFDKTILDSLPAYDRQVQFIYQSVIELASEFEKMGGSLIVRYGNPEQDIPNIAKELQVDAVMVNHDYEPQAQQRDEAFSML